MKTQYHLFFSGRVQGVWFRGTSESLAQKYNVKGWVRNLPDASVEMVAEAPKEDLDNFLADLKKEFKPNITSITKQENQYSGKYQNFKITF